MPVEQMQAHSQLVEGSASVAELRGHVLPRELRMFLGLGCLLGAAACTAVSDFSVHQCEVHADCARLEGGAWQCEASRCVPGCASNQHCADTDPRTPICPEPGAQCVSLSTADGACYASTGFEPVGSAPLTAKDMLTVGAFAPTVRSSTWLTLKLAVDEINAAGGLSSASGDQPLVVVLCQDSSEALDPAMDHLIREIGVRGIVASLPDDALRVALERPATKERALFLSPNGADAASAGGQEVEQLLWYWGSAYDRVLPVYPALVESLFRASSQALVPDNYRIAILSSPDREDQRLAQEVSSAISVGEVASGDLARFGRLRSYVLAPGSPIPPALADYAPELVLLFAGGHDALSPYLERSRVVAGLETFETAHPAFRPMYVFGPRNGYDAELASAARANEDFRARALLVSADRQVDQALAQGLASRFAAAYPALPEAAVALHASGSVYDALYYLALAIDAASRTGAFSASEVRDGLLRITDPSGEPRSVGPSGWQGSRQLLEGQAHVNLSGSSGPAAFDGRTRPGLAGVRCWRADGTLVGRGTYDAATARLITEDPVACAEEAF
jgi:hypothetical protein